MHVPSEAELAAISAAYVTVTARATAPVRPEQSRWRLAGRLPDAAAEGMRFAANSASRWNAAGRFDD